MFRVKIRYDIFEKKAILLSQLFLDKDSIMFFYTVICCPNVCRIWDKFCYLKSSIISFSFSCGFGGEGRLFRFWCGRSKKIIKNRSIRTPGIFWQFFFIWMYSKERRDTRDTMSLLHSFSCKCINLYFWKNSLN